MRANTMIFVTLCLILCWMQPAGSKKISFDFTLPKASQDIPLSMVEEAVDDMYFDCSETMMRLIKDKYFKKENTGLFATVWKKAKRCADRNEKNKEKGDKALTKDHLQAICVYTASHDDFYKKFNEAVRTKRKSYGTSFQFHSIHFWLTSAIQILNKNRDCLTTYRRTASKFTDNNIKTMRFGFFTSSSKRYNLTQFGKKTCFKINTCHGAFLKKYPRLQETEEEVLIPPYEKFTVTKAQTEVEGLDDCEVVYILESAGVESNLDCKLVHKPKPGSSSTDEGKWKVIWGV